MGVLSTTLRVPFPPKVFFNDAGLELNTIWYHTINGTINQKLDGPRQMIPIHGQ